MLPSEEPDPPEDEAPSSSSAHPSALVVLGARGREGARSGGIVRISHCSSSEDAFDAPEE